jgi:hypothetical protein
MALYKAAPALLRNSQAFSGASFQFGGASTIDQHSFNLDSSAVRSALDVTGGCSSPLKQRQDATNCLCATLPDVVPLNS